MHKFLQIIFIFHCFTCSTCFGRTTRPSSGALCSELYHAFRTFVQASLAATRLPYNHVAARLACTNVPTAWYSSLHNAPDDGRVVRPKHVEQTKEWKIKIIYKNLCILLVYLHRVKSSYRSSLLVHLTLFSSSNPLFLISWIRDGILKTIDPRHGGHVEEGYERHLM